MKLRYRAGQACIELLSFSVALPGQNLRLLLEAGEFEKALEAAAVAGVSKQIVFQEKLRRLCQSSGNESGSLSETVELIEVTVFCFVLCVTWLTFHQGLGVFTQLLQLC